MPEVGGPSGRVGPADSNDWIVDSTAPIQIRPFVDLLVTNLTS